MAQPLNKPSSKVSSPPSKVLWPENTNVTLVKKPPPPKTNPTNPESNVSKCIQGNYPVWEEFTSTQMWVDCPYSSIQVSISILSWSADGQHEHQIAHTDYGNAIVCPSHMQPLGINISACVLQKPHHFFCTMKTMWTLQVWFRCLSILSHLGCLSLSCLDLAATAERHRSPVGHICSAHEDVSATWGHLKWHERLCKYCI